MVKECRDKIIYKEQKGADQEVILVQLVFPWSRSFTILDNRLIYSKRVEYSAEFTDSGTKQAAM